MADDYKPISETLGPPKQHGPQPLPMPVVGFLVRKPVTSAVAAFAVGFAAMEVVQMLTGPKKPKKLMAPDRLKLARYPVMTERSLGFTQSRPFERAVTLVRV